MPCKHYKDALIEAAASGAEPRGELRAHLTGCDDCRAAFEKERSLFASIDAGLHVAANAEVPASLLPRVRARLDEESVPRRIWVTNWLVLASAAVIVVAFFSARAAWHQDVRQSPSLTSVQTNSPESVIPPTKNPVLPSVELPKKEPATPSSRATIRNSTPSERSAVRSAMPEVLVPRDQEELLVKYAQQWSQKKRAPLLAANSNATDLSPLEIAPIQIAQLDVKLMTEVQVQ